MKRERAGVAPERERGRGGKAALREKETLYPGSREIPGEPKEVLIHGRRRTWRQTAQRMEAR